MTVRIQGKPVNMSIIEAYAPTTASNENTVDAFIGLLLQTIDDIPNGVVLIIMGDMNAKVGENEKSMTTGKIVLGVRNAVVERLMEFCEANSLK